MSYHFVTTFLFFAVSKRKRTVKLDVLPFFVGCGDRTRTCDLRVMRNSKFMRQGAVLLGLVVLRTKAQNGFCPMCTKGYYIVPTRPKPFWGQFWGQICETILTHTAQINAQLWFH